MVFIGLLALLVFKVRAKLKRGHRLFRWRKKNAQIDRLLKQKIRPAKEYGIKPNE